MKTLKLTLSLLFLTSLLACSTTEKVAPVVEVLQPQPPEVLLRECEGPPPRLLVKTKDIILDRQEWMTAFEKCRARQSWLRAWHGVSQERAQ